MRLLLLAAGLVSILGSARSQAPDTEAVVTVIGVQHAPGILRAPLLSPAHVRACLAVLKPEVVCVESAPEWFREGKHYRQTYEARGVAIPWARTRGIPVYGVDWVGNLPIEKDYSARRRREAVRAERAVAASPESDIGRYQYGVFTGVRGVPPKLRFAELNSEAWGRRWTDRLDAEKDDPRSPMNYLHERDGHIVAHIREVVARHPGARIAVVIGAAHKLDLDRRLPAPGLRVGTLEEVARSHDFDDPVGMDGLLEPEDAAAILAESWDGTATSALDTERTARMLGLLARSDDGQVATWSAYFAARHAMLRGRLQEAWRAFAAVAKSEGAQLSFPHRGIRWRTWLTARQAAWLEMGRIDDVTGERERAVSSYRRVLADLAVPPYSEDRHSPYLPLVRAHNAVRALVHRPYRADHRPRPAAPVARRDQTRRDRDVDALLDKSMGLSRKGQWKEAVAVARSILENPKASAVQTCEALMLAASSSQRAGEVKEARGYLERFDRAAGSLSPKHWTVRARRAFDK